MEVLKEVRVKKEPISQTTEATMRSNYDQSIKHERQSIHLNDRKRTREDISSDVQLNKRIRQSMKVKEEPIDTEMQTSKEIGVKAEEKFSATKEFANKRSIQSVSIAFLNQETTKADQPNNPRKKKSKVPNNLKGSYKCYTWKEFFNGENQLRKHQRIHTGERPNECDICYKSFDQPIELEMHKMIHSGKKTFECDICDKAFFESFRLESHRKSHFRERPFECDICQVRLINSNDLENHRRTHSREKL